MATTAVRLTIKFNFPQQIRFCGWTESYDLGYADLPTAIAGSPNIAAFVLDRAYCLGIGPVIVEAVLSGFVQPLTPGAAPVRRSTISFPVPALPAAGSAYNKAFNASGVPLGTGYFADFSETVYYMSLQTNLSSTPVYRRSVWIAGLPDVADETDSPLILDPATRTAVQKFMNDLANGNLTSGIPSNGTKCGVAIRSVDRSGANAVKPCTAWNLSVNTYTVQAHGFAQGQPVIAEGMKTIPGGSCPRGRYLVGPPIDANTISLQGSAVPTAPIKTGGFRAAIVSFNAVQIVQGEGFTKRNKGRPSGLSVGRRRTPLIRRA